LQLQTLRAPLQLSLSKTGVGAVVLRPGLRRALLQSRRGVRSCPPCDRQTPNEGQAWALALQLPKGAGPVPAELRTPQALSHLRRRTPQRPDRGSERDACTLFAGLRWSCQNFAAAMIEPPCRHGHLDPRWHTDGLSPRDRESDRAPMIRTAGDAGARISDDEGRFPRQRRHALVPAVAGDDGPSVHRWENEGGSYSTTDELVNGWEKPPAGLECRPRARSSVVPRVRVGNSFTVAGRVSIRPIS
jgi:hypothetical protein